MSAKDSTIGPDRLDDFAVGIRLVLIVGIYVTDDLAAQMPQVEAVMYDSLPRHAFIDETLNEWCKDFENAPSIWDILIESLPPLGPFLKAWANIPNSFHLLFSG